jgi:hypothetical protein
VVGGQHYTPAALHLWKKPGIFCTGGWVGLRGGLHMYGKNLVPTGVRAQDHPACSELLYRLRCPGLQLCWHTHTIPFHQSHKKPALFRFFPLRVDYVHFIILNNFKWEIQIHYIWEFANNYCRVCGRDILQIVPSVFVDGKGNIWKLLPDSPLPCTDSKPALTK